MNSPATCISTESGCFGRSIRVIVSSRNRLRRYFSRRQISVRVKAHAPNRMRLNSHANGRLVKATASEIALDRTSRLLSQSVMSEQEPRGYYAATIVPEPHRPALNGRLTCDICVVGGGYTGLSAALHAAETGARVVLLEAQCVGFG